MKYLQVRSTWRFLLTFLPLGHHPFHHNRILHLLDEFTFSAAVPASHSLFLQWPRLCLISIHFQCFRFWVSLLRFYLYLSIFSFSHLCKMPCGFITGRQGGHTIHTSLSVHELNTDAQWPITHRFWKEETWLVTDHDVPLLLCSDLWTGALAESLNFMQLQLIYSGNSNLNHVVTCCQATGVHHNNQNFRIMKCHFWSIH